MSDAYFCGMRATGDLASHERPESWRPGILRLFPNGSAPLTALTNLMRSERVDDWHYHWWTKTLTSQRAAITGDYKDAALATPYVAAYAGDMIYWTMAEVDSKMFHIGHVVMGRLSTDYRLDTVGKVVDVVQNGASSYIAVKLLEDDDNGIVGGTDLTNADVVLIIGNMNAQGAARPEAIAQAPSEHDNYTQIFRNSLDLARTLMRTKLRTADAYLEAKRDALELHSIEMEKAFLWGIKSSGTGTNNKPEYTTQGLIPTIKADASANCDDFTLNTAYSGQSWAQGGEKWLDTRLESIFRYGKSAERLAFCGSGFLLGLQEIVKSVGQFAFTEATGAYGIQVIRWVTPFGRILLKTHPLFSYEATNRNSMVVFEPKEIRYRYIDDTFFKPDTSDREGGGTGKDGKEEEFLTEAGLEFHHPETCGYLNGGGLPNAV